MSSHQASSAPAPDLVPGPAAPGRSALLRSTRSRLRLGLGPLVLLIVALGAASFPLLHHLPWWGLATCIGVALWRLRDELGPRPGTVPPTIVYYGLLIVLAALLVFSGTMSFGIEGSVPPLIIFLWLKLIELRSGRDVLIACFLGFFLVVSQLLGEQSFTSSVYAIVCTVLIAAAAISLHGLDPAAHDEARPEAGLPGFVPRVPRVLRQDASAVRSALLRGASLLAQALPLAVILFLLIPRPDPPPRSQSGGRAGLSDLLAPGQVNELRDDPTVAFRASALSGVMPDPAELYWRGPVLSHFDGVQWSAGNRRGLAVNAPPVVRSASAPVIIGVLPEPGPGSGYVYVPECAIETVPGAQVLLGGEQYRSSEAHQPFQVRCDPGAAAGYAGNLLRGFDRTAPEPAAAVRELAERFAAARTEAAERGDAQVFAAAEAWYRAANFTYTRRPGAMPGDWMPTFLFDRRAGLCQHFAGSFAALLRLAGVPARVVVGFQGGERNPLGDFLTIRNRHAHAWCEVWLGGDRGWHRVDPTAFAARYEPDSLPPASADPAAAAASRPGALLTSWAWLDWKWHNLVVSYDRESQLSFLHSLGIDAGRAWPLILLGAALLAGGACFVVIALFILRRRERDPVLRAWLALCHRFARRGFPRLPHEGPLHYAARLAAAQAAGNARLDPARIASLARAAAAYARLRYGPPTDPDTARALRKEIR